MHNSAHEPKTAPGQQRQGQQGQQSQQGAQKGSPQEPMKREERMGGAQGSTKPEPGSSPKTMNDNES